MNSGTAMLRRTIIVLEELVEFMALPEKDCHCHISPPCNDCVENSGPRELAAEAGTVIVYLKSLLLSGLSAEELNETQQKGTTK